MYGGMEEGESFLLLLSLFTVMDFPIHIDTISMALSILCFKGSLVKILSFNIFQSLKIVFCLITQCRP